MRLSWAVLPPLVLHQILLVLCSPMSYNDPFRALVLRSPTSSQEPVCCLTPLPPVEPTETEVLLSFEEWKEKQLALQKEATATSTSPPTTPTNAGSDGSDTTSGILADEKAMQEPNMGSQDSYEVLPESPHFRVPLTDRFNYASLDCSARVHTSHRSAKSSSSILSSKKDRYMLSPCKGKEKQFLVVELCDDIRIDTVQLANFEFFSGVFKDFTVSVAKTYTTDQEGWTVAGTYRAKNIRGVQSFHPPTSLRDFYRYIRIDFHSHYSNEYYCPVSLLRVYGLTHLEEWKWEVWETESRAKRGDLSIEAVPALDISSSLEASSHASQSHSQTIALDHQEAIPMSSSTLEFGVMNYTSPPFSSTFDVDAVVPISTSSLPMSFHDKNATATTAHGTPFMTSISLSSLSSSVSQSAPSLANDSTKHLSSDNPSGSTVSVSSPVAEASPSSSRQDTSSSPSSNNIASHKTSSSTFASTPTTTTTASTLPSLSLQHPSPTGGESIYRTIMNRLTTIETNHTLYTRYVEDQMSGIRDVLRRIAEDVGRLEGIGKAQSQMYARTVGEWEKQRKKFEMDYNELSSRVNYLSDEVILEKRLGIAQLCLLLTVLVFMALTRGSRGETVMQHGPYMFNQSMRDWSRRHLSFGSDWMAKLKPGSSRSSSPAPVATSKAKAGSSSPNVDSQVRVPFSSDRSTIPKLSSRPSHLHIHSPRYAAPLSERRLKAASGPRSRTPSLHSIRGTQTPTSRSRHHYHPTTATLLPGQPSLLSPRPRLKRANSHGTDLNIRFTRSGVRPVPNSAKRLARSAHLHQLHLPSPSPLERQNADMDSILGDNNHLDDGDEKENTPTDGTQTRIKSGAGSEGAKVNATVDEEECFSSTPTVGAVDALSRKLRAVSGMGIGKEMSGKGKGRLNLYSALPAGHFSPTRSEEDQDLWVDTDSSVLEGESDVESSNGGQPI